MVADCNSLDHHNYATNSAVMEALLRLHTNTLAYQKPTMNPFTLEKLGIPLL